jgi:Tfp pilus assembly protein PilX
MGIRMGQGFKINNCGIGVGRSCSCACHCNCCDCCCHGRDVFFGSKQNGFILVTTLIFLLILTLLAVGALEMGILQLKINQNSFSNAVNFQVAESALRIAENSIRKEAIFSGHCFDKKFRGINDISSQTMAWWRSNACSQSFNNKNNSKKLYYWVEEVSRLTCGELDNKLLGKTIDDKKTLENSFEDEKIKAENSKKIAIVYYRITGRAENGDKEDSDSGNLNLQSTFAKAVVDAPCVLQIPHKSLGRQSWREVEGSS